MKVLNWLRKDKRKRVSKYSEKGFAENFCFGEFWYRNHNFVYIYPKNANFIAKRL
jgi:hypothetical protein